MRYVALGYATLLLGVKILPKVLAKVFAKVLAKVFKEVFKEVFMKVLQKQIQRHSKRLRRYKRESQSLVSNTAELKTKTHEPS